MCLQLYEKILAQHVFEQEDAPPLVELIKKDDEASLQSLVNDLRKRFQGLVSDPEDRKAFVHLLAKFVKSYHFLSSFFSYEEYVREFVAFCEYVGPQLIKTGLVSELMKQVRATVVEKSAVIYEGQVDMLGGLKKPKTRKGGGGGAPVVKKVSVQDMITKIRESFDISEEDALHIREVSEEKISDESIQQTVAAHKSDTSFLETVLPSQINGDIQDAYALRELYEQLGDPKYTDRGAIFDIMAFTVVQAGLEMASAMSA